MVQINNLVDKKAGYVNGQERLALATSHETGRTLTKDTELLSVFPPPEVNGFNIAVTSSQTDTRRLQVGAIHLSFPVPRSTSYAGRLHLRCMPSWPAVSRTEDRHCSSTCCHLSERRRTDFEASGSTLEPFWIPL